MGNRFKGLVLCIGVAILSSCSWLEDDSIDYRVSKFSTGLKFQLNPNEPIVGDSIEQNLGRGVLVTLRQGAEYTFSFESEPNKSYELNFLRILNGYFDDKATFVDLIESPSGVYTAQFNWEYNDYYSAIRVSDLGGGKVSFSAQNIKLEALGTQPTSLDLLVHLAGYIEDLETDEQVASFKSSLQNKVEELLAGSAVTVGSISMLRSGDHPVLGDILNEDHNVEASFDQEGQIYLTWNANGVQTLNSDQFSEGLSAENQAKLDLVFVNEFKNQNALIGISPFFGGGLGTGEATSVLITRNSMLASGGGVKNSNETLAETFVHEMGHFFGLRHTTASLGEYADVSLRDDGFSDTPYSSICKPELYLGPSAYFNKSTTQLITARSQVDIKSINPMVLLEECPDVKNLMFPFSLGAPQNEFSNQQKGHVYNNLKVMPR